MAEYRSLALDRVQPLKLIPELQTTRELEVILNNRLWIARNWPYPHVVARNVFAQQFYAAMEAEFNSILQKGLSECSNSGQFSRVVAGYDTYGIGLGDSAGGALSIFGSPGWHDLIADLFEVEASGQVNIGVHHHRIGSQSGWIHNDFNPVWFPADSAGRIRHPDHARCDYKTGAGPLSSSEKIEVVRAVAMIFYLCNNGWKEGDGGETGLFESLVLGDPCRRIVPESNSILLFECTPRSYHTFLANPGLARNSIIMWIHRDMQGTLERWPEHSLERWC